MPNNLTWEDRMFSAIGSDEYDAIKEFGEIAAKRAEDLDEDDLADNLREYADAVQHAIDEWQDYLVDLDKVEKYVAAHPNWRNE